MGEIDGAKSKHSVQSRKGSRFTGYCDGNYRYLGGLRYRDSSFTSFD